MAPCIRSLVRGALAAAAITSVCGSATENSSAPLAILELTEATFQAAIDGETPVLVEFYAPWCGNCKSLKAEVERAAEIAHDRKLGLTIARIDAPKSEDVSAEYEVKYLPTFVLFGKQGHIRFPTLSTAEAMLAGAAKLLGEDFGVAPVKTFTGPSDEFTKWMFWRGSGDGSVHTTAVLFTPPGLAGAAAGAAGELRAAFEEAAVDLLRFTNLRFAAVSSAEVMEDFELPSDRAFVAVYIDHDEGRVTYDGPAVAADIRSFVLRHDVPLVTDVNHRNLQSSRKRVESLALFFLTGAQLEDGPTVTRVRAGLQAAVGALAASGKIARGNFTLGLVDGTKYSDWLREYGLPLDKLPALVVENTTSGKLYAARDLSEVASEGATPEWVAEQAAKFEAAKAEAAQPGVAAPTLLTWADVPSGDVIGFLSSYADGVIAPVKVLAKRAAPTPTPTPLAAVLGSSQSGHAEEL